MLESATRVSATGDRSGGKVRRFRDPAKGLKLHRAALQGLLEILSYGDWSLRVQNKGPDK